MIPIVFAIAAMVASAVCTAQSGEPSASTLHDRVVATYTFLPRSLGQAELEAKSRLLDAFWAAVKADGAFGVRELRSELGRNDLPVFFNYDGAKLLLSLSHTREDRALALTSIARADLRDLQPNDYFLTVHSLAVDELDTTEAAFKILSDPKFQVFIPQHALTLAQEMCLVYLLLPTKESYYLNKVEQRLFQEKDVTAQKSLLGVLADTVTKRGDDAIARFSEDHGKPDEARAYARLIIDSTKSMSSMPIFGISFSSYDELKAEQRALFGRVSDEALGEWQRLRVKLRSKGPK